MRLANKVAVITGGATGIGSAIAEAFLREGAKVCVMGRRTEVLEEFAAQMLSKGYSDLLRATGDVTREMDVRRAITSTAQRYRRLDILVNNAGVLYTGTADSHSEEEFATTLDVNVTGVWRCVKAALPHMRESGGGSIVNMSSVAGLMGIANRVAYGASKGAVTIMTKCMAADLARDNIRVNCICPGVVETDLVADIIRKAPDPEATRRARVALHPLGRFGTPEDIAGCAVFLGSDESRWMTGAAIPVDGGYVATKT